MKTKILILALSLSFSLSTIAATMVLNVFHTTCGRIFYIETKVPMTKQQASEIFEELERLHCP